MVGNYFFLGETWKTQTEPISTYCVIKHVHIWTRAKTNIITMLHYWCRYIQRTKYVCSKTNIIWSYHKLYKLCWVLVKFVAPWHMSLAFTWSNTSLSVLHPDHSILTHTSCPEKSELIFTPLKKFHKLQTSSRALFKKSPTRAFHEKMWLNTVSCCIIGMTHWFLDVKLSALSWATLWACLQ